MKYKWKAAAIACLLLCVLTVATGCTPEKTPYDINDGENYNVSIKYDANGGFFTTNTSVIVDSYNITEMQTNSQGDVQLALLSPDDSRRGNDAFTAVNNGYFLAGWYSQRTETADGSYTYSGKWDFEKDLLPVAADGSYTASEPVLTLYAAWVPMFEIELYAMDTGEYIDAISFDPTQDDQILVPQWDMETGCINMNRFPDRKGYTFAGAYYDAEGKQGVDTSAVEHPGEVDYTTGTANNASMKLYVDWLEGEWYHIYNVDQFLDNASVGASFMIYADLDFTDRIWPTSMMYGNYTGSIQGNGHTFKNIVLKQTNNSKVNAGLFGYLTEDSSISDLTFENVSFTIEAGTRVSGASFGLLAGTISDQAVLSGVSIKDSTLKIDSNSYFSTDNFSIGLVTGMGQSDIDDSGISCIAVGDAPESVKITVKDGTVQLEFAN